MKIPEEKAWVSQIMADLTSVIVDDPHALKQRNERFGSYLPYLSTLIMKNRVKARRDKENYNNTSVRPEKGIKVWEEDRDAATSESRYWFEYLTNLRDDVQRRISTSQTVLNYSRAEMQAFGTEN